MENTSVHRSNYKRGFYIIFLSFIILLNSPTAFSRDVTHLLSIQEALQTARFQARLNPSIRLYFGNQKHPKVARSLGRFVTNKKTNAFNKSDREACQWVLLSSLLSLQTRAIREGGNAVINITSYYKKNIYKSNSKYECHTGSIIAGVALRGEVVTLGK